MNQYNKNSNKQQIKRLLLATLIIAVFFVALAWASTVNSCQKIKTSSSGNNDTVASAIYNESVQDSLDQLPENFDNEVIKISEWPVEELNVSEDKNIINISTSLSKEQTAKKLQDELKRNRWVETVDENESVMTFSKSTGSFRWLLYNINLISDKTVIVLTVMGQ